MTISGGPVHYARPRPCPHSSAPCPHSRGPRAISALRAHSRGLTAGGRPQVAAAVADQHARELRRRDEELAEVRRGFELQLEQELAEERRKAKTASIGGLVRPPDPPCPVRACDPLSAACACKLPARVCALRVVG